MTSHMARTMIVPAAVRYQAEVAQSVTATKQAGGDPHGPAELLKELTSTVNAFQSAIATLEKAVHHHAEGDVYAHAKFVREHVVPAMAAVRTLGDKLETLVADDLWPLPTYRELLFLK
jgi:glutamine synthetase